MVALKDFDHTKEHQCTKYRVMPKEYDKKEETQIFREACYQAWRQMRQIIPVEFRAKVTETYRVIDDIMKVTLTYKPLL